MKTNKLQTKQMDVRNNQLYIGDFSIEELANTYQTPLYVYDEDHIRTKLEIFQKYFKDDKINCHVVYATKAFFAPYLLDIINENQMWIDSVSMGDMMMIGKTSFPYEHVVLHGNYKKNEELEYAVNHHVGYLVVDNMDELKRLDCITKKLQKKVNILLRINSGVEAHTHQYIQTSKLNSKFGESVFDLDLQDEFISICKQNEYIQMEGYHSHIGSSINEPNSFIEATKVMLEFIKTIELRNNYKIKTLNLGGGFGIKYLESDRDIDLEAMLTGILKIVKEYNKNGLDIENLLIEPGRCIAGDAGFTIYNCGGNKLCYGGKHYVFVDGGMTDNIRPALYQAKYTCDNASNMNGDKEIVDIAGPCCESGDIIVIDTPIQKCKENDKIVVYATGAYCHSMSSNYNGAVRGAVVFVQKDQIHVAIERETYDDLSHKFPIQNKEAQRIFDCHCDLLYDLWTRKAQGIENRFENYHVNQLRNSSIGGGLWTMYSEFDFNLIEACKIAISEIKNKNELLPNFKVVLGLEGLRNLHEISELDTLYEMGFRHAMVTWNEENKWATGAKSNPEKGFTKEGIQLLKHMEELGMIIDLAHTNEKSFWDAIKTVNKNIIYSHGLTKKYCNHPRNLTDEQLVALREKDGLFGITLAASFIAEEKQNRTFEQFKKHVRHAIDIMGVDNICFGFDFMDYLSEFPNCNLVDVSDATFSYRIIEMLREMGYNSIEINKMCYDNFYRRYGHLVQEF